MSKDEQNGEHVQHEERDRLREIGDGAVDLTPAEVLAAGRLGISTEIYAAMLRVARTDDRCRRGWRR